MENEDKITYLYMPAILKRYRDEAGLSQRDLAERIDVSKGFISALEGGRSVPSLDRLVQIAGELGIEPGEMVNAMMEAYRKDLSKKMKSK